MNDYLLNGTPALSLGLIVAAAPGWLDAPSRQTTTVQIPGRAGATPVTAPLEQPRKVTLQGVVRGRDAADCRAKMDRLKATLFTAPLTITFPDAPTRFVYADVESWPVAPGNGASMIAEAVGVEIGLLLNDPYSYDTAFTTLTAAANTPIDLALGTAAARPLLTITGPAASSAIHLFDQFGDLVGQMAFAGLALNAGETLTIDCDAMTITAGAANALSTLTAGDFLLLDPATLGGITDGTPGTILTTSGTLTVAYRKAWR